MEISTGYYDITGLAKLRVEAINDESVAAKKVGTQFEAMFLQDMLKSMRAAIEPLKDEMSESSELDTFQEMFDKEVSISMADRGSLGVADWLVRHSNMIAGKQESNVKSVNAYQANLDKVEKR
jgi:peptidoglycan hydrolase FlgJ